MPNFDLWGKEIIPDVLLRDKFIEPPFSVLDTRKGLWQARKRRWLDLGIQSEVGRGEGLLFKSIQIHQFDGYRVKEGKKDASHTQGTSIFDPALTELMYNWFCPEGGHILDPFAGGSVRGIVAHHLGFNYTGIELRPEQVESNIEQAKEILAPDNQPEYLCGDSEIQVGFINKTFDFIFSCPPYADLEVYSELPEDLSTMSYPDFKVKYYSIIKKSLALLKTGKYACFVVGEVRGKDGFYYDFVGDTKRAFIENGAKFYNDAILLNVVGSASVRADRTFGSGQKLIKIHQNVLVFKKV